MVLALSLFISWKVKKSCKALPTVVRLFSSLMIPPRFHHPVPYTRIAFASSEPLLQIAMSLRDTTTDENELAMGYTVPQERLRRGRSSTWCYEPATNLIGDVFRHPPSVAPNREARRERSLSKDVRLAAYFEKES